MVVRVNSLARGSLLGTACLVLLAQPVFSQVPPNTEFQVNAYTNGSKQRPHAARDGAGNFVVVWQNSGQDGSLTGIFGRRFDASAAPAGGDFQINTYTLDAQDRAEVAQSASGDFVVVWNSWSQDGSFHGVFGQRYDELGTPQGPEFLVNSYTPGSQYAPSVAMNRSTSDFIVAWEDGSSLDGSGTGVFGQRFASSGMPQGPEFQVNSYTPGIQFDPAVAANGSGDFVVAWTSEGDGSVEGIFAQRFDSSGNPAGGELQVNSTTPFAQTTPDVAIDDAGNFVVVWETRVGCCGDRDVAGRRFDFGGNPTGPEFAINTYTTNDQLFPQVSMSPTGDFVVAWQSNTQDGDGLGTFAQAFESNGTPVGVEFQVNSYTLGNQLSPAVALDTEGDFVIAWSGVGPSELDVFAKRYEPSSADASFISGQVLVDGGPQSGVLVEAYDSTGASVVGSANTNDAGNYSIPSLPPGTYFVLTVNDQGYIDELYQGQTCNARLCSITMGTPIVVPPGGGVTGVDFGLAMGGQIRGTVLDADAHVPLSGVDVDVFDAGGSLVTMATSGMDGTYTSLSGLVAGNYFAVTSNLLGFGDELYDGFGCPNQSCDPLLGTAIAVTTGAVTGIDFFLSADSFPVDKDFLINSFTPGSQTRPAAAMDGSGRFIVSWAGALADGSGSGVVGRLFDANGDPLASDFLVNSYTTGGQDSPAVSRNEGGDFVIVWRSDLRDESGSSVIGQRYDSAGATDGPEFLINTYTTGDQESPSVAIDSSGSMVAVWESASQDGSGSGIFGRRYDASGLPQGPEFQVNTYTASDQRDPSVAMGAAGDFVVVWETQHDDGVYFDIAGQRYDASGNPQGSEFLANTYTTRDQEHPSVAKDALGNFVVVWERSEQFQGLGSLSSVYGQRFDMNGGLEGAEFAINTYTTGAQTSPSVATNAFGEFTIAWQSFDQDGSRWGTFGRAYDSAGSPLGGEFQVNSYTPSDQALPAVAMSRDTFLVVWEGHDQLALGEADIYGRRYSSGDMSPNSIAGRVTDAATGLPLAGVFVEAYGPAGTFPPDGFDTTDASGLYSIQALAPGSYFILTLNDQGYTDELHVGIPCNGRTCDITTGHAVTLLAGATIGGVNFELDAGNRVLGTVTNVDTMSPAANVFVDIYDDSASLVTFGTTAADGTYRTFGGLADGDYFALTNNGLGLLDELYDDFPDPGPGCSLLQGTFFTLPGASSIDFGLSSNPPSMWAITDCTIDETRVFEAQSNVTAGGAAGFVVAASGNVTFRSGETIVLTNGFSVADGATFTAEIDPSLKP